MAGVLLGMAIFFLLWLVYCLQALPMVCNGSLELCDRRVDQVSFPTAHNAMAAAQYKFIPPDHIFGLQKQFIDGIRGFSIDLHPYKHTVYLCHSFCEMGKRPLFDWLVELKQLLLFKPNDVILLIFESYASPAHIESIFDQVGLLDFMHTQDPDKPWPTLKELKSTGRRIIAFSNQIGEERPSWQNSEADFIRATNWNIQNLDQLNCELNFLNKNNSIYRLCHMRQNPFANMKDSTEMNTNPFLLNRARQCQREWGHIPNLVEVTFYSQGNLTQTVDLLNKQE